jgi:hypothetical protein
MSYQSEFFFLLIIHFVYVCDKYDAPHVRFMIESANDLQNQLGLKIIYFRLSFFFVQKIYKDLSAKTKDNFILRTGQKQE